MWTRPHAWGLQTREPFASKRVPSAKRFRWRSAQSQTRALGIETSAFCLASSWSHRRRYHLPVPVPAHATKSRKSHPAESPTSVSSLEPYFCLHVQDKNRHRHRIYLFACVNHPVFHRTVVGARCTVDVKRAVPALSSCLIYSSYPIYFRKPDQP